MLQKMAREQYNLEITVGPFGIDSRPALILEKYAESEGKGNLFHDAIMHAYWQEARSIDDKEVLKEIAESVGLNVEHFADVFDHSQFDRAVTQDMKLAESYGLTAVPALIFAEKYLISGAQPYETLKRVVEKIQQEAQMENP